jgi:hypothetical protein
MASWTCCETPDLIARQIDAVRMRTDEPFGVNLIPAATDPGLLKAELSLRDNDLQNTCASFQMRVIAGEPFLAFYLTFCVSVSPIDLPFS